MRCMSGKEPIELALEGGGLRCDNLCFGINRGVFLGLVAIEFAADSVVSEPVPDPESDSFGGLPNEALELDESAFEANPRAAAGWSVEDSLPPFFSIAPEVRKANQKMVFLLHLCGSAHCTVGKRGSAFRWDGMGGYTQPTKPLVKSA